MKIGKGISIVGLLVVLLLAGFSFFAKDMSEHALSTAFVSQGVTPKIVNTTDALVKLIMTEDQVNNINREITELMNDDASITVISLMYIQASEQAVNKMPASNSKDEADVNQYIDQNRLESNVRTFTDKLVAKIADQTGLDQNKLSALLTDKLIDQLTLSIGDKASSECNQVINNLTPSRMSLVKVFLTLTTTMVKVILLVLGVLFLAGILLCSRPILTGLLPAGIVSAISGLFWLIMVSVMPEKLSQLFIRLTKMSLNLNVQVWRIYGLVLLAVGIIAVIIGVIARPRSNKSEFHF